MTKNIKCDTPNCELSKPCIKCQKRMYKHTVTSYQKIRDYLVKTIDEECSPMAAMVLKIELEDALKLRAKIVQKAKKIQKSIDDQNEIINSKYQIENFFNIINTLEKQTKQIAFGSLVIGLLSGATAVGIAWYFFG